MMPGVTFSFETKVDVKFVMMQYEVATHALLKVKIPIGVGGGGRANLLNSPS